MLFRHLALYILFNVSLNFSGLMSGELLTPETGQKLLESVIKLTDSLIEVTPYINLTLSGMPPNCVQMLCKFVCFNGKSAEIEKDILIISKKNKYFCSNIDELRLYNYEFPDNKLSNGFLGSYSKKVDVLYLASSNITEIEAAAFAKGRFQGIYFENLYLKELKKDFFEGITYEFNTLSIIQKEMQLQSVHSDFLDYVKYQIKYLTLQAGLKSIQNLTGGDFLLDNLLYMDFSHNDFGKAIKHTDFSKVSMIEYLDLSHSNLEYLPAYLFAEFILTLDHLDLSYNKLKMISRNIFGWRELPHDLRIYAKGNEWSCSCELQRDMKSIFVYYRTTLFCSEPKYYAGWSVFDDKICGESSSENVESIEQSDETTTNSISMITTTVNDDNMYHKKTTASGSTTTAYTENNSSFKNPEYLIKLDCLVDRINVSERIAHLMHGPLIAFTVIPKDRSRVDIVVDSCEKPYDSFALIWFNKATTKYYKMEINYKEYGLGCHKVISFVTAVENLTPNTSYTFCLVFKLLLNVSPFNCKSIYVGGNPAIKQIAWLTRDMKKAGWSLVIIGIFLFLGAGILMIYLLLKRKPILLKSSKRVTTMHSNSEGIVVLPKKKSVRSIKEKEEILARYGPFNYSQKHRRKSNDSEVSYDSYINNNFYEVIPSFENLNSNSCVSLPPNIKEGKTLAEIYNQDMDKCYLTPLESMSRSADLVQYAEIPYRAKRNSNDALPQLPVGQHSEYAHIGTIYILDSQV